MAEKKHSGWLSGLVINLVSNVIALLVGGTVTYFSHEGSVWVNPMLCGGAAWLLTFCSILAFRASRHVPKKAEVIDGSNVHVKIRDWLDRYQLTVKNATTPDMYFFLIVTTEGNKKVSISRQKGELSDYIFVKGLISWDEKDRESLNALSEDEKTTLRLATFLELSRAVMGYKSEKDVLEEITIFKRIPITSKLNIEEIINVLWEIEAMLGSLLLLQSAAVLRNKIQVKNENRV
jgi:hypothetical protein